MGHLHNGILLGSKKEENFMLCIILFDEDWGLHQKKQCVFLAHQFGIRSNGQTALIFVSTQVFIPTFLL